MPAPDEKFARQFNEIQRHAVKMAQKRVSRGEFHTILHELKLNVASVALAIEAFEQLMVEKGILAPEDIMDRIAKLTGAKAEEPKPEENKVVLA